MEAIHHVDRAIIMAAGKGTRLAPVTQTIPKPLVKINGTRMIDTVIRALHNNGIYEIYVVIGYLKEKFAGLEEQYPGLKLIENPYFDTCNNISSLYVAREHLENAVILDGDQIVFNDRILAPDFRRSGYSAIWTEEETDEWLMRVENDVVTSCSRTGGSHGWQLFSISRWSAEDGRKLRHHLEVEFDDKRNRQIYWDDVVMFCHFGEYQLGVTPMEPGDIVEIDSFADLVAMDPSYAAMGGTSRE